MIKNKKIIVATLSLALAGVIGLSANAVLNQRTVHGYGEEELDPVVATGEEDIDPILGRGDEDIPGVFIAGEKDIPRVFACGDEDIPGVW